MHRSTFSAVFLFALSVLALPSPQLTPDPAGEDNIGNGAGGQFIGGACLSSADCASGCCATLNGAGICSGVGAQFQDGKQGCGFGDGAVAPNPVVDDAPTAGGAGGAGEAGGQNVGKGDGSQFITGRCLSDADCASGCCANPNGVCSAAAAAFESGKQGCGFVGTA
ncbi:hypothetical protein DL769_004424 [Monosporascus sp. CRB-8-3]|nr:hypothetical protein DL769_004424 [Monosporascus sp. CRB-8-3]